MLEFNKIKLSNNILDGWIKANLNVCLIGKHGVGKSTIIMSALERHGLKYKYFSGATLDPWIDVIGIPTVNQVGDKAFIDFILPKEMDDTLEAIVIDEFSRTHKSVRNALLELVQFKSINGRKFPNLKFIWAAINPDTDEETYNVEAIDPAQLDRFHIITELYPEPDLQYFNSKYPKEAKQAIDWYNQQSADVLKFLSPRRLDYVLEARQQGINIKHLLPKEANAAELIRILGRDVKQAEFDELKTKQDKAGMGAFLSDQSNFARFIGEIKKMGFDWLRNVNPELLDAYALSDTEYSIHRKASGFDPNATKFFNTNVNSIADYGDNIIANLKLFYTETNFRPLAIDILLNSYKYSKNISNLENITTQEKSDLYNIYCRVLHEYAKPAFDLDKFNQFLIGLGRCQINTLKGLAHLNAFSTIAAQILREKNKYLLGRYGNLSVLNPFSI